MALVRSNALMMDTPVVSGSSLDNREVELPRHHKSVGHGTMSFTCFGLSNRVTGATAANPDTLASQPKGIKLTGAVVTTRAATTGPGQVK